MDVLEHFDAIWLNLYYPLLLSVVSLIFFDHVCEYIQEIQILPFSFTKSLKISPCGGRSAIAGTPDTLVASTYISLVLDFPLSFLLLSFSFGHL